MLNGLFSEFDCQDFADEVTLCLNKRSNQKVQMPEKTIRIGTRGSQLALIQANYLKSLLQTAHNQLDVEISVISTRGDRSQKDNIALSEIGGKGLFTAEIESQLLSGDIDMAVHSAKDMSTALPDGLALVCYPERENVADAFIAVDHANFGSLPDNAVIGSASLRRRALMWRKRPDLNMVMFRGNVDTRLDKVSRGEVDATLLACAGLNRMQRSDSITEMLDIDDFPPAPGQGAITVEANVENSDILALLQPLNHTETETALICEAGIFGRIGRFLPHTPIGAHATIDGDKISLHGIILKPDGSEFHEGRITGTVSDARSIGIELGKKLVAEAGDAFFEGWA